VLPFIVLLAVPVAVLERSRAQALRGLQNDVYCQIGLFVDRACQQECDSDRRIREQLRGQSMTSWTRREAARIRLRPI